MYKWIFVCALGVAALVAVGMALPRANERARAGTPVEPGAGSSAVLRSARGAGGWTSGAAGTMTAPLDPTLAAIYQRLMSATDDDAFQSEMSRAYRELSEQIKADPAIIARLEAMLAGGDPDKPMVKLAVGALGSAGTPAAQSALVRLADARKGDVDFMELVVPTMGFTRRPTVELEGALRRLSGSDAPAEVRGMAHLAVGTAAARLAAEEPARARSIVESYGAKLAAASDAGEITTYLSVLGNSRSADAGKVIERYLADERGEVRAKAVDALRLSPSAEAERRLTDALQKDGDATVRANAAWALSYREPTAALARLEADALSVERDAAVGKRLLETLWTARDTDGGGAREALARAATSHPVAAVRDQARTLLAQP